MGKVFSEVMDAIGMGGPDLVGKLDKISTQLVDVQKSLDRLTEMTAEILKQLAELKDFMEKSLQIGTLVGAITKMVRNSAMPTSTWLGGAVGVPRPDRMKPRTMRMRVKPVSVKSAAG